MTVNAWFYKSVPYLHGIVHLGECATLLALFIKMATDPTFLFQESIDRNDTSRAEPFNFQLFRDPNPMEIAFSILLFISALLPFITVISYAFLLLISLSTCWAIFISPSTRIFSKGLLFSRATQRFLSLNCNCPCYQARPALRFQFRFAFLAISTAIRIAAIIGCVILPYTETRKLAIIFGICCVFYVLHFLLDFYHLRMLWYYKPDGEGKEIAPLSKKHKRYLPYHLLGHNRSGKLGDRPCKYTSHCRNRQLEHIMIFHARDYHPQPRWSDVKRYSDHGIYIGFHQTTPEFAIKIAHSDFKPSMTPPQMLGFGIYFARSLAYTFGKARNQGAFICAEIRMGKVKEIIKSEIETVRNSNAWWEEYDTVYYNHEEEYRDEFCIKSSSQIIRWVISVADTFDKKIHEYGMDTEYKNTKCGCC